MPDLPNPGSEEALVQGCKCPVLDNHYGAGLPWPDPDDPEKTITAWWKNEDCPLHGGNDAES